MTDLLVEILHSFYCCSYLLLNLMYFLAVLTLSAVNYVRCIISFYAMLFYSQLPSSFYCRCSINFFFYWREICPLFYALAEFINLISSESNEVCSREEKRTIAPEHVLKALQVFWPILYTFSSYLCDMYLLTCFLSVMPLHLHVLVSQYFYVYILSFLPVGIIWV